MVKSGIIAAILKAHFNDSLVCKRVWSISGGDMNEAYGVEADDARCYFVKLNHRTFMDRFEAEAFALRALKATGSIRVPAVLGLGEYESIAYLLLEHLEMKATGDAALMGEHLAAMHRNTHERFGWESDNFIGKTPQINTPQSEDWVAFFKEHRLRYQMALAEQNGLQLHGVERLFDGIEAFFDGYSPVPSLLHGDLWGGNAAYMANGEPVLYDPASYYGDREVDLAFTEMFGGFSATFYQAYQKSWPMHAGYSKRKRLYNLYHVLNHYNLFGGGYGRQAQRDMDDLIAK